MTSSTSVTFFRPCDQCDSNDYKLNSVGLCITNVCYKGIGRGGRAKCEAIIILLLSFRLLKSCGFLRHSIVVLALRSSLLRKPVVARQIRVQNTSGEPGSLVHLKTSPWNNLKTLVKFTRLRPYFSEDTTENCLSCIHEKGQLEGSDTADPLKTRFQHHSKRINKKKIAVFHL